MKFLIVVVLVLAPSILSVESKGRIINGRTAPEQVFPYQVRLNIYVTGGRLLCGGSLIDKEWVLTAAHCFESGGIKKTEVELGNPGPSIQKLTALQVIMKEDFFHNNTCIINDIALVKIPPADLNAYVRVIKISKQALYANQEATVAGWGLTGTQNSATSPTLKYTTLNLVGWDVCRKQLGTCFLRSQICTFPVKGSTTCAGDSGGPLVIGFGQTAEQIGLVSYGTSKCSPYSPAAYTRISSFLDWIKSKTGLSLS